MSPFTMVAGRDPEFGCGDRRVLRHFELATPPKASLAYCALLKRNAKLPVGLAYQR